MVSCTGMMVLLLGLSVLTGVEIGDETGMIQWGGMESNELASISQMRGTCDASKAFGFDGLNPGGNVNCEVLSESSYGSEEMSRAQDATTLGEKAISIPSAMVTYDQGECDLS